MKEGGLKSKRKWNKSKKLRSRLTASMTLLYQQKLIESVPQVTLHHSVQMLVKRP